MTVTVVTSCSAAGYKQYGRRMLETLHRHWPMTVSAFVVSEDPLNLPDMYGRHVDFMDLTEHMTDAMRSFYARHIDSPRVRGIVRKTPHYISSKKQVSDFRFDAWKFSKKVFAIALAAERCQTERLIWLDADTVTFVDIPLRFLEGFPSGDGYGLACLDRGTYHSECGFVSYYLPHPKTRPFIAEFARLYTSDEVFKLREWHDSFVFDTLRRSTKIPTFKIPHTSSGHPFVNSSLGYYMDHLKGLARKGSGFSTDHPRFGRQKGAKAAKTPCAVPESVSAAGLRARAELVRTRRDRDPQLTARHLELAAAELERLQAIIDEYREREHAVKEAESGRDLVTGDGHTLPGSPAQE